MPRASKTRTYGPRKKYSLARSAVGQVLTPAVGPALGSQATVDIVAAIGAQGKRKCKNFDINLALQQNANQIGTLIYYALVYVPSTTTAGTISNSTGTEYYSPPNNVIAAGIYDCDEGTGFRIRTRLARNLNSGDAIQLVMRASSSSTSTINLQGVVSYVVAFN